MNAPLRLDRIQWDAHSCLPLDAGITFEAIDRHRAAGFDFVSINVGMDPTALEEVLKSIAWFRARIAAAPEKYALVGTIAELEAAATRGVLAIAFDLEGADCLLERPEMVQLYADLGVRQMHLAYNLNNAVAGGCHDAPMHLTALGHEIVAALNAAGIVVDCSHSGRLCSMDIMAASSRPVVFSHANCAALHETARNVTDEQIRACAATGGVIGITGYKVFLHEDGRSAEGMAAHIDHVVQLVGIDHAGIGWDFCYPDEGVPWTRDPANFARFFPDALGRAEGHWDAEGHHVALEARAAVAERLSTLGYRDDDIAKVMGGNFLRVARACWPGAR